MARILLVDDNEDSRFAVRETLRRLTDYVVDEAESGEATFARVKERDYDLVLLDIQMPAMDGFEVCRQLRREEQTSRVPVLFLTATHFQVESRLKGLEVGADDFIVQPVSNQELVARIKAALRVKALSDEIRQHNAALEMKVRERTRDVEKLADQLRAERDTLRETFDLFQEALCLVRADGQLDMVNATGRRLYDTALAPELKLLARQAVEAGVTCDRTLADAGRLYAAKAYPVSGARALLSVRDVTEERDFEMRRLQAEKLASIGMLAAGVAHEINNPAAFVLANIDAMSAQLRQLDERMRASGRSAESVSEVLFEAQAILQESKEGMARIQRIVRDLGSFSHADDDSTAAVEINGAVESALTMLRNELKYRTRVERDLRAKRSVQGNVPRLGQVFLNLVINAAQALDEAEVKRNLVRVRSFDEGDDVVVEVEDNGPGIAPEVLPRIFESFFTTKPRGIGTGLGLPISQGIVRAMGGDITVETELGRGSTFRVRLPAVASVARGLSDSAELQAYPRRRVLAVDDEALLLKAYSRMLGDFHDIVTALGGTDAYRLLEADDAFDAVICDLQMPDMSGMELLEAVRLRFPQLADRFVFVTGGAFSTEAKRFIERSDCAVISKPFRVEELLSVIERTAALARLAGEDDEVAPRSPGRPGGAHRGGIWGPS